MADRTRTKRGRSATRFSTNLLAGQDAAEVFRSGTLIDDLKKAVAERALDAEMEAHLEREARPWIAGNHRNGHNRKRVLTDSGAMDPGGSAGPAGQVRAAARGEVRAAAAGLRRQGGVDVRPRHDDACPADRWEIQGHVRELYGLDVSPELVSKVTDAVHDEISEWQARPLDDVYAIVYFDAVRAKISGTRAW